VTTKIDELTITFYEISMNSDEILKRINEISIRLNEHRYNPPV